MKHRLNNQLPINLPQLQNLIKRDPASYQDEFLQQLRHFESLLQVFELQPHQKCDELQSVAMFLAQVSQCYKQELKDLPHQLIGLLRRHRTVLNPDMRMAMCKTLIFMRNKDIIEVLPVFELFFVLFRCQDKALRRFLYNHIITDIKNINKFKRNNKVNTSLQNFMFGMLKENHPVAAKAALDVLIELYKKNVWRDTKVVNVICTACLSKVTKIMVTALNFFLGSDEPDSDRDDSSESEEEIPSAKEVIKANKVNKKSRKRKKQLEKIKQVIRKKKQKNKAPQFNFSAIHLINDPQGLCEKLYSRLEKMTERFEVKVMVMQVISRIIGIEQLILLNFYPYLQKYLQPHQREVVKILGCCAQSCHPLVPPDVVESVIRTIADNFITDRNAAEVMAVGLNAVREICLRCPLGISEDLLHDLTMYKKHKDKGVNMAAKSLIQLYRITQRNMLMKKDRGQPTQAQDEAVLLEYGKVDSRSYIPGAEVLANQDKNSEAESDSEEEEESGSDSEWEDVQHSSDEEEESQSGNDQDESLSSSKKEEQLSSLAEMITMDRILTQEDFQKIDAAQLSKHVTKAMSKTSKRKLEALTQPSEFVKQQDIEMVYKKKKHDKQSRLETVLEGRKERGNFGKKLSRQNVHASTSNKEKGKRKNFMMMRHKSKSKPKASFKDKQRKYRNALQKQRRKLLVKK